MAAVYKYISPLLLLLMCLSISQDKTIGNQSYELISMETDYVAGDLISLKFRGESNPELYLYISNAYGSTLVSPSTENNQIVFDIPQHISKKAGQLNWTLLSAENNLSGVINISPTADIDAFENYIGPPTIFTGETDFSMMVSLPTDQYDNVLADSTVLKFKHQYRDEFKADDISITNGYAWKRYYSKPKTGRILLSSSYQTLNSKEYDVTILPSAPQNFTLDFERVHDYADGNQITTFQTSVLKDVYDNIVSDGTFVNFYLTDSKGVVSQTFGLTVQGIASATFIHPDHEEEYSVKAYIEGIAESEPISIAYQQAVDDFEVEFSDNNREITVGPIQSFMDQRIPDGLNVQLKVYIDNELEDILYKETRNGFAVFSLKPDRYPIQHL